MKKIMLSLILSSLILLSNVHGLNLLYLKCGDPTTYWTIPNGIGSQYKEITEWQNAGYTVTTLDLGITYVTTSLLNGFDAVRFNGMVPSRAFAASEGVALYNWVNAGGNLMADIGFTNQVPAVSLFGVQTIEGQNGGSTGLVWYFHGAPMVDGPINGPIGSVPSFASSAMDHPVLATNNNFIIDYLKSGYPMIIHNSFGSGKVIIIFTHAWSYDSDYPTNAYRANIYQEHNIDFLHNCIQYFGTAILGPVDLFVGVSNSDDNGRKIVLKVDLYKNDILIGSAETSTTGLKVSGNAEANCTYFNVPISVAGQTFNDNDILRCDVFVKRVGGSGNFGVKLWDNNEFQITPTKKGGSRIQTVPIFGSVSKTYYFTSDNNCTGPYTGLLSQTHGSSGKYISRTATTDYSLIGSWSFTAENMKSAEIESNEDKILKIYPNPSAGSFTMQINNEIKQGSILIVQDLTGKEILHTELSLQEGVNTYPVSITGISEGMYIVSLQTAAGARQLKLIIRR